MKIKDIVKESRPRERLFHFGSESLSDAELLAIILRSGSKNENVIDLSNKLISKYGLSKLFECELNELCSIKGIGMGKASQIVSVKELSKRIFEPENKRKKILKANDVFDIFKKKFFGENKEYFFIVLIDTKNYVIKTEKISMGILDASIVHPREVFRPAIRNSASRIILVHNHPSGDPTPSEEDLDITNKLINAGNLIGIDVLDHIIIGRDNYWSWIEGKD